MAVATGIRERIGYVAETTIGTTPTNPNFQLLETTGFNVNPDKEVIQDNRLGNRNRRCNKHGNQTVSGDIPGLLVYGAADPLIEAGFCGTWTAALTTGSSSLSATTTSFDRAAGSFVTDGFVVGSVVESTGFTNAGNNGLFAVTAVAALSLTVSPLEGQTMTTESAATGREVAAPSQLKNGITRKGFSFMRENPEISATSFRYYKGIEINTIGLELAQNDNVSLTLGVIGVEATKLQAAIAGQSTNAASSECPFDYKYGSLNVDGTARAQATAFSVNVENGIESSFVLFSDKSGAKPFAKFDVNGDITLQFDSSDDYNAYMDGLKRSIILKLEDAASAGNEYALIMPQVMLNSATTDTGGEGEITLSAGYAAELDTQLNCTAVLIRKPAA